MDVLNIIGRKYPLFSEDLAHYEDELTSLTQDNSFLVIGGGGSIGQAVSKELFARGAKLLHIVDINENYLVELVRDIRSSLGYRTKYFDTFAIDCGDPEFEKFFQRGKYDYVLNLSAMKHVRSENDAFSMYRMLKVNMFNTLSTYEYALNYGAKKYFCVSTDKAANPANFMGATKRAMEIALMRSTNTLPMSGARFANVAFSNGSLLQGFEFRLQKLQPLSVPSDIRRFFVTAKEAGIICLFSTLLGARHEIFFPYNEDEISLNRFTDIAHQFLRSVGRQGVECSSEDEARELINTTDLDKYWPINIFTTDTVGEKAFEEFHTLSERVSYGKFKDLASVKFKSDIKEVDIHSFKAAIQQVDLQKPEAKIELIELMSTFVPSFHHVYSDKTLNMRM